MDKEDLLLEQWKLASELHRHEDNLTWQRFNYFVTANGLIVSILGVGWAIAVQHKINIQLALVCMSLFGALISFVWGALQQRGRLYHRYRIAQAKRAEDELKIGGERVLTVYQFSLQEQGLIERPRCLARIPGQRWVILLAYGVTLAWLIVLVINLMGLRVHVI